MAASALDGALVVQRADLFYLSGTGQDAHLFVPLEGAPLLLVRKNFHRAAAESPLENVVPLKSLSELKNAVLFHFGAEPKALGMELDVLPVNNFRLYQELFSDLEIKDVSPLIKEMRMIKSPYELGLIRRAAAMNHEMFEAIPGILKDGMTEIEFSGLVEAFYRGRGHQGLVRVRTFNQEVFYGHIMSGPSLAVPSCSVGPTGGPGPHPSMPQGAGFRKIRRHEPIQVDYVGVIEGYIVDQARTFFMGEPPGEFLKIHEIALKIQNSIAEEGVPGVPAERLYETALTIAHDAGLSEGFLGYPQPVPFVGHGVGLELDELPVVGRRSPHILEEGMVIALEPKFILPGRGLAGIENTFVVTQTGMEKLTRPDDAIKALP